MEFKYLSSVKGRLVPRFPTMQQPVTTFIGATRKGKVITWNEEAVAAVPLQEFQKYRREYKRRIADGSLKERTEQDFKAWQEKQKKASEDAKKAADTAKKEATAETKKEEAAADSKKSTGTTTRRRRSSASQQDSAPNADNDEAASAADEGEQA